MAFFTIGSLVCAIAANYPVVLTGRLIQAAGGGILMPLSMNMMLAIFPLEKRGSAMGIFGLGIILAPALGPTVGGWFIDSYDWHLMFYAMTVLGAVIFIVGIFNFKIKNETTKSKLDLKGAVLSTSGFGLLLYGISESAGRGWGDIVVIICIVAGIVCLALFIILALRTENPLLEIRVFKNVNFTFTLILNCVMQMALFSGIMLLPIYLQGARGFTPLEAGLLLLPGSLVIGILGVFTGKWYDLYGARLLAIIGISIMTVSMYFLTILTETTSYSTILIIYTVRSFGMAFVMMPLTTAALAEIKQELIPHATALLNTIRQVAGAFGTSIFVAIMAIAMNRYVADLGGNVAPETGTLATIYGIDHAFLIATFVSAAALALSFFLKKPTP